MQIYTMDKEPSESECNDQTLTSEEQEKIRKMKNKVRTLINNVKDRKGAPLPSREEVDGFDLKQGDYVDYFRYMVQHNELPEPELYDIENWGVDDFFGPSYDIILAKVREREKEASELSQLGDGDLLEQNGTESDVDREKANETVLGMALLAQGANSIAQGADPTTQGVVTPAQGAGVGLGPPVISGTVGKPKALSKQDIRQFLSAGPGSDGYIM